MDASLRTLYLREPFRIAHGTSSERTVLRLESGGRVAEAPFVPYYGDDAEQTLALLQSGAELVDLPRPARLAINLLEHDLAAVGANQPLSAWAAAKLGASSGFVPPGCRSLGIPDDLGLFAERVAALANQFRVLKLKLGSGDLGLDLAIVDVARRASPETDFIIDVNGAWDPTEAPLMIEKLSGFHPVLIEQPIHHSQPVDAWAELRAGLPENVPPIYADESVQNGNDLLRLAPHIGGVNVKLMKCGSFDAAVEMIALAREHGLGVLLGCMIETSLGTTAAAHLAPWADWIDLDGHFYVANDDYAGIEYRDDGSLKMPEGPGIGAVSR